MAAYPVDEGLVVQALIEKGYDWVKAERDLALEALLAGGVDVTQSAFEGGSVAGEIVLPIAKKYELLQKALNRLTATPNPNRSTYADFSGANFGT